MIPPIDKVLRNLANPVPPDVQRTLNAMRQARLADLHQRQARAQAARLTADEKREINMALARAFDVDLAGLSEDIRKIEAKRGQRLMKHSGMPWAMATAAESPAFDRPALTPAGLARPVNSPAFDFPPVDLAPGAPDRRFWWSETLWSTHHLNADFREDGLHFFGYVAYYGDDLLQGHAGAVARFALQPERREPSPSLRYDSEPQIELFGTIHGFTGYWHPFLAADDKWCKCRLFLRQTAYLHAPGGQWLVEGLEGPRIILDEENRDQAASSELPGLTKMPPIRFEVTDPAATVWIELEARFEFQLEGVSFLSFSPEDDWNGSVILRTPQWAPTPV
jgi:hypothetical protein